MTSDVRHRIERVGIIVNPTKTEAFPLIREVAEWLVTREIQVLMDSAVHDAVGLDVASSAARDIPARVDLIVAFGGDGTMLSVARQMNGSTTPLMGVKVGGLGFLTEVTEGEVFTTLEEVLDGRHRVERRMMLSCAVVHADGSTYGEYTALNDVVIQRDSLERLLTVETYVGEEFLASYACDGLIFSTPTGSTAHSLSAGGPIVYPQTEAIVVTPICPHMLTNRPLVLSSSQELRSLIVSEPASAGLMIDGQVSVELNPGDQVMVRKSPHSIHLAASSSKNYFEILRTKLNWGRR